MTNALTNAKIINFLMKPQLIKKFVKSVKM